MRLRSSEGVFQSKAYKSMKSEGSNRLKWVWLQFFQFKLGQSVRRGVDTSGFGVSVPWQRLAGRVELAGDETYYVPQSCLSQSHSKWLWLLPPKDPNWLVAELCLKMRPNATMHIGYISSLFLLHAPPPTGSNSEVVFILCRKRRLNNLSDRFMIAKSFEGCCLVKNHAYQNFLLLHTREELAWRKNSSSA